MNLGDIIKQFRKENSMSMGQFSEKSGLSKGYISMLENNKNPRNKKPIIPSLETIKQISQAMGISLDTLIKRLDNNQEISLGEALNSLSLQESLHLKKYRKLNKTGRNKADEQINDLLLIEKYTKQDEQVTETFAPQNRKQAI